jgi:rSAM/selenodomain-associated transferase 1
VYYSVKIRSNDIWDSKNYQKNQQVGEDLGIRMQNAFKNGFDAGYKKVVIIGSDLYDLTSENIEKAFTELDNNDVVLGPAEDGGYYLLGMNLLHSTIFKNKKWGTQTVRKDTLTDLKDKKVHLLEELNDIDIFEDIKYHPSFQQFL